MCLAKVISSISTESIGNGNICRWDVISYNNKTYIVSRWFHVSKGVDNEKVSIHEAIEDKNGLYNGYSKSKLIKNG